MKTARRVKVDDIGSETTEARAIRRKRSGVEGVVAESHWGAEGGEQRAASLGDDEKDTLASSSTECNESSTWLSG